MVGTYEYKIVPCLHPLDNTGGANTDCDVVSLKNWDHATFIIDFGAIENTMTGTLIAYKGLTVGSCTTAFACKYRYMSTSDTWGALTTLAVGGVVLDAAGAADCTVDNVLIAVEIDAADLNPTTAAAAQWDTVRVGWTNNVAETFVSILCILSRGRYKSDQMPTAITD